MNMRTETPCSFTKCDQVRPWSGESGVSTVGDLELRINGLSAIVDSMSHSTYGGRAAESSNQFDFIFEVRVKVEAVRWMLRVVEHFGAATSEYGLSTITRSVKDLEDIVYEELCDRHSGARSRKC